MKILTDNFDKLVMVAIFFTILGFAITFQFEWLTTLARDSFLVLTALLGYRRQQPAQSANTTTGDVIVSPQEDLQKITDGEIENAVEQIREEK